MTTTLTALYDNYEDAAAAIRAIQAAGMAREQISIVTHDYQGAETRTTGHRATNGAATGATIGAVIGGSGCLMAGLGIVAIPGLGPVIAAGWLAAMAVGVVAGGVVGGGAGGILGALMKSGVPEEHAHVLAEGVRRGGTLVTVRVVDDYADRMEKIMHDYQPVDPDLRGNFYRQGGWTHFDDTDDPYLVQEISPAPPPPASRLNNPPQGPRM
jgi:hypothetical protein